VTVGLSIMTMALHVPLEAFSLGRADDIDPLAFFKEGCSGMILFLAGKVGIAVEAEFLDHALGPGSSLLGLVGALGKIQAAFFLVIEGDLDGGVAIGLRGLDLEKFVSVHIDDSDGDHAACLYVKDAGHTDFFTEDSE